MNDVLELVVPMPPHVTNRSRGSTHWRRGHREKTRYWETLDLLVAARALPKPPARPFTRVTLRSCMRLGGAMDDDNALARHKYLIDWLRRRGYIADDRRRNIRWLALPEQTVKRDGRYTITLQIQPDLTPHRT